MGTTTPSADSGVLSDLNHMIFYASVGVAHVYVTDLMAIRTRIAALVEACEKLPTAERFDGMSPLHWLPVKTEDLIAVHEALAAVKS